MNKSKIIPYSRDLAVAYATKWSLFRNPSYLDFSQLGGDCTNFISQCIYAGSHIMNFNPLTGWYYRNPDDRAAAWTGVTFLCKYLTTNTSDGPFGTVTSLSNIDLGDIIQLEKDGSFYHSLLVTHVSGSPTADNILISAHSFDAINRPLSSYNFDNIRCIHIEGVRKIL